MAFPFVAPFDPWITSIMEEREKNQFKLALRNPFAVMTSGALVVRDRAERDNQARVDTLKDIIREPGKYKNKDSYRGCIISNNINDLELSYAKNETPVGVDFDGKVITVSGESGRMVSTPIIESIDIDTDGANNTLKTTNVTVRCFTLKQLELFEMFFMKPGMNILVEFGDSALLYNTDDSSNNTTNPTVSKKTYNTYRNGQKVKVQQISRPEEALIPKNNYEEFCKNFSNFYNSDTDAIGEYISKIEQTLGSYDLTAGKLLDYSFTIEQDGTYVVTLEITQGNQVSLALPLSSRKKSGDVESPSTSTEYSDFDQIIDTIVVNLDLEKSKLKKLLQKPHPEANDGHSWEDEFFNFIKVNTQHKDSETSADAYISLRFILMILMNYVIADEDEGGIDTNFFQFYLPTYEDSNKNKKKVIPVNSNKNLISTTDKLIFPTSELPIITVDKDQDGNPTFVIDTEKRTNGKINGYNFHKSKGGSVLVDGLTKTRIEINDSPNARIGDALNIFIKFEEIVRLWNTNTFRVDFLDAILALINGNQNQFTLIYGVQHENGRPTIIDRRFATADLKLQNTEKTYRFKPHSLNSIVRNFDFNFELSNLAGARQVFNSGQFLREALKKDPSGKLDLVGDVYKQVDNSTFSNADGWYSLNYVEFKALEAKLNKEISRKDSTDNVTGTTGTDEESPEEKEKRLLELIENKSISFILPPGRKKIETLIFLDKNFILDKIKESADEDSEKRSKSVLSPITVNVTIDGFSGFRCGQYFRIDGVPEIYNQIGAFQITNIKHSFSTADSWQTTIEADFLIRDLPE